MCVLAETARTLTFWGGRGNAVGRLGGRRLEDGLRGANKVDRSRGHRCLL